jgi:hypothetical protein
MIIPSVIAERITDQNGVLTPAWQNIFMQLFTQLQINFSDEGLVVPSQTTANIALLTTSPFFTLVGDRDTNELKVALDNGMGEPEFKVIQTS